MKKLIPLLALTLLIAWCSDYNKSTLLKIQELEKQAQVLNTACNNLEKINKDINNLKGYIDNQTITTPPTKWNTLQDKPISCTKTYSACLEWDTINIKEDCRENFTPQTVCSAFSNDGIEGCFVTNNQSCLLNDDLEELNKIFNTSP